MDAAHAQGPGITAGPLAQDFNGFNDLDLRWLSRRSPPGLATCRRPCGVRPSLP